VVNSDQYLINVGKTMPCLPSPRKITIFMTVGSGYQSQMGGLWHCFNHKKLMMSMMLGNSDFFWLWLWFYIDCYMFFFIVTIVTMIFWLLLWHCYCDCYIQKSHEARLPASSHLATSPQPATSAMVFCDMRHLTKFKDQYLINIQKTINIEKTMERSTIL